MELWTEYEGSTIDSAFPLKKLLLPEGRSAFFATSNAKGDPTVIRLIACHFDEEEILARWRGVKALGHPNILRLEQFGQLVLDDTTVVYAVMEPVDANLAEVITDQRLSVPDARQLATSIASALDVLHTNGFVHEHVEPANIYAVGEVVKLRGDCIRETPEGEAGLDARKHDIHNLGVVLLEALEHRQSLEASGQRVNLPAPFDRIVPNAINGSWTLPEIISALGLHSHSNNGASTGPARSPSPVAPIPTPASAEKPRATTPQPPAPVRAEAPASPPASSVASSPRPDTARSRPGSFVPPAAERTVIPRSETVEGLPRTKTLAMWAGVAVAALFVIWLIWHYAHSSSTSPAQVAQPATVAQPAPGPAAKPAAARTTPHSTAVDTSASQPWRVIAFTYNRRDQAEKKSASVAQKHPDLHPQVFTPTGRAPFLVTVGGPMSRDAAYAFARNAGKWGLPRDTYAQNYTGKRR